MVSIEARLRGKMTGLFTPPPEENRNGFLNSTYFDERVLVSTKVECSAKKETENTVSIDRVDYTQLHGSYEELPHRYLLKASARGENLRYVWKINCGYFVGPAKAEQILWYYDTPGECVDAVVTVWALDDRGRDAEKAQKVFQ